MSSEDRQERTYRTVLVTCGWAVVAASALADFIGLGHPGSDFGRSQQIGVAVGLAILWLAWSSQSLGRLRTCLRLVLGASAVYATLIMCDLINVSLTPSLATVKTSKNPMLGLRGLYSSDPSAGHSLTPGWNGHWDDGMVRADIRINSRGHRDDEPLPNPGRRLLLLGDSFAFGLLLEQSQTIDKGVERLSRGELDAYNLGVPAYGPPAIHETLRRVGDVSGTDVVYLFYQNDLSSGDLSPGNAFVCKNGYLLSRFRRDGSPYTDAELRSRVARIESASPEPYAWRDVLTLWHLRKSMPSWSGSADWAHDRGNVAKAHQITRDIQATAYARRMAFHVVIIPSVDEVKRKHYDELTGAYADSLRQCRMHVIELIGRLAPSDYFEHDGHFNASGAQRTAEAIVEAMAHDPAVF